MSNVMDLVQKDVKERPPHVRFERVAVENVAATKAQGIYVAMDVDFVTVTAPGGGGNGVKWKIPACRDYYKREIQNGRMPQQWLDTFDTMYERWKSGQDVPLNGIPIRGWLVISPAQQETLVARGIHTIEDLAAINAEGIQRIGMGGMELKNKAVAALQAAKDTAPLVMKNAQLESELSLLKANFADLERKLSEFASAAKVSEPEQTSETISADDILDDNLEELSQQYAAKFGQPPHHRMKRETIERALRE